MGGRAKQRMRASRSLPLNKPHYRRPFKGAGLVHHSDRRSQYLPIRNTERLGEAGIEPSVGSVGDDVGQVAPAPRRCFDPDRRRAEIFPCEVLGEAFLRFPEVLTQAFDEEPKRRIAYSIFYAEAVFICAPVTMCIWAQPPKNLNHSGSGRMIEVCALFELVASNLPLRLARWRQDRAGDTIGIRKRAESVASYTAQRALGRAPIRDIAGGEAREFAVRVANGS